MTMPDRPSAETVDTAVELLKTIPITWTACPGLSRQDELARRLLCSVGLVELRASLRVRAAGLPKAVATTVEFTANDGLESAVEAAMKEAYATFDVEAGNAPERYTEAITVTDWRLTEHGVQARGDAEHGDLHYLNIFLSTPATPFVSHLFPGVWRPAVNGYGRVVAVEVVDLRTSKPLPVHVDNLHEVVEPLERVARGVAEAGRKPAGRRSKPRKTADEIRPLTDRQSEAIQFHGECEGNFAEMGKRMKIGRKTAKEHYQAGMKKLGQAAQKKTHLRGVKKQNLPHDGRGQVDLAEHKGTIVEGRRLDGKLHRGRRKE